MNITQISVRRPAAITMALLLLIGLGILGYRNMGADMLPSVNVPVITISTSYSGAGADEIKQDIVKPIESAVSGISGIDTIQSTSRSGMGMVILQFTMETDMNSAFIDVQKAVDNVVGKLPKDAGKPSLYKVDINASSVLTLSVSGDMPYAELYNQANDVQEALEKLPGVGKISLQGGYEKQLSVKVDKAALEYYGVNMNTLLGKLQSDNITAPVGEIKQDKTSESVRVMAEYTSLDEVNNLMIPTNSGGRVRLSQIAKVQLEYPDKDQIIKLNGKSTIGLSIQKQSDANVVEVVNTIKAELKQLQKTLPKNVKLVIADDTTTFINNSLGQIKENVVEGIITTAIVLLLFLRSWRSSLVVLVAIPTSLISTFFMMYELKFTLNMMTLMALSLCVGILVDDSIVILENIQRHLQQGKDSKDAAIDGRMEIGMAAIAITLCDVVVFAPVAFMSGMVGQYFKEFGLTVVFASLFSLLVSFTITPMLSSLILKAENNGQESWLHKRLSSSNAANKLDQFAKFFEKATIIYEKFLNWSLNNRWKIVSIFIAGVVLSIALLPLGMISTEFLPQSDDSKLSINLKLSPGTNVNVTDEKAKQVEAYLKTISEVTDYYTSIGNGNDSASASITVKLKDKKLRKRSQNDLANIVRSWGKKMPGVDFSVGQSQMGGGGGGNSGKPININLKGSDTEVLDEISKKVQEIVKSIPGTADVSSSADNSQSEIQLKVDRLALAEYGISISDVNSVLRAGLQGSAAGTYRENGDEHDIVVKFIDGQIKTAADIGAIKVVTASGQQIFLNQIASVVQADSPKTISRIDRQDTITISANIHGRALGPITTEMKQKLGQLNLPYGYSINYGGTQKMMADSFSSLMKAIAASIVLVYMILVVLYESFLTPAIRMLSLPCAIIGAFLLLAVTGKSLNMMSMIGLIMLDGLASKNGTLLIDYTNTLMKKGLPLREALVEAGTRRLRPIIMTSATMIVGMIPTAIATGAGSELRSGMSWVIIGGMITSTIFSPIILPVVYTLMDDLKTNFKRKKRKNSQTMEVQ